MPLKTYLSNTQLDRIKESHKAQAIIDSGIFFFGEYGEKGTTIRMIAEHSNSNSSAITYYFGSKKGLYIAIMQHIVEAILLLTNPFMDSVESQLNEGLTKSEALQSYKNVMMGFVEIFTQDNGLNKWSNIILREHVSPSEAFEIFYNDYFSRAQILMRKLIAILLEDDYKKDKVMILSHAIFSQTLGFLIARESLKRGLKGTKITNDHHEEIKRTISDNIDKIFLN